MKTTALITQACNEIDSLKAKILFWRTMALGLGIIVAILTFMQGR